jgi:hypothetical protein
VNATSLSPLVSALLGAVLAGGASWLLVASRLSALSAELKAACGEIQRLRDRWHDQTAPLLTREFGRLELLEQRVTQLESAAGKR